MKKNKKEEIKEVKKTNCECNCNDDCNCNKECSCKSEDNCECHEECECTDKCNCKCDENCNCGDNCECGCIDDCNCNKECGCKSEDNCKCHEQEISELKNSIKHLEEKVMLSKAELINYRKRKDEETSNMLKFANMDLILEILPVLDNFERALNMKGQSLEFDKYNEGYELIYSHLIDVLKKFGVEEIPSLGLEFDPNIHEAVMISQDSEKGNDVILEVFNKGYTLKGRVIRPAKVKVNKLD